MSVGSTGSQRWLFGPAPDLLLGCGLAYALVFVILVLAGPQIRAIQPSFTLPLLIMLFSMPHYGGTLLRVYEQREDRRAYVLFSVWATLLVLVLFVVSTRNVYAGSLLFTLYLSWSPWHYSGQNYGIALMFLRRRGVEVTPFVKRWVYASFVFSFLLTILVMHLSPSVDYTPFAYEGQQVSFLPVGIPMAAGDALIRTVGIVYLAVTVIAAGLLLRRGSLRDVLPAAALALTQALWFSAPWAVRYFGWHTGLAPLDQQSATRDYTLWIFVGHGVQYLWVTTYYARAGKRWRGKGRYLGKAFITGVAVWTLPFVIFSPDALGSLSFDNGLALVVAAMVNIHHFILDGAIWKLRQTRIANVLIRSQFAATGAQESRPSPFLRRLVWATASLGVAVALFEFWEDQIHLPAVSARGDAVASVAVLDRLSWIGYDKANRRIQFASWLDEEGDQEAAARQFRRGLELGADTGNWVVLGSIEEQLGHLDQATDAYERSLAAQPSSPAQAGLGRVARRRGDAKGAIRHFREALRLDAGSSDRKNELAWALATSPDAELRRPEESIRLAQEALSSSAQPEPNLLSTLAAGYAAAGRFEDALRTADQALEIASARGPAQLRDTIGQMRELYRAGRPFVDDPALAGS